MTNITINILNCGCGCGGKSTGGGASGGWTIEAPPYNDLGDPQLPSGPPDGYLLPPGTLADRQCKMAVWLYDWLESTVDTLGNTSEGANMLTVARLVRYTPYARLIYPAISAFVTFVIGLFVTPGLTPDDAVTTFMAGGITAAIIGSLANIDATYITQPAYQEALPIIQANQDAIICTLSQATSAQDARERLEEVLADQLQTEQRALVLAFIPDMFLTMLFYTPDWWPSFDDDYLAGITTVCCGDAVNDTPITPGSTESCQASYYIVEQLAVTMQAVADTGGIWSNWNPFDNDRPEIYDWLDNNLATPRKIKERAYSYSSFLNQITEITYSKFFLSIHYADLSEFADFATYINSQVSTLTAALQDDADTAEAYTTLQPLFDWITTNIEPTDSLVAGYMTDALNALIKPPTDKAGILDLLFSQDADLAGYAVTECGGGAGASGYLTAITEVTITKNPAYITDENELLGAEDSADDAGGMHVYSAADHTFGYVIGDFGQVYANAVQLELRVRGYSQYEAWRILDHVTFAVSEDNVNYSTVGSAYINQTYYADGVWRWVTVPFGPVPLRYVKLTFNRGQAYGYYGHRWFDACKVVTE